MIKDIAIRNGLWAGVATIGYFLLFYVIDKKLMLHYGVFMASSLVLLFFMIRACRQENQRLQELPAAYPFALSLKTAFTTYVVGATLYYVWYYLMFNNFDPGLVALQKEIMIERVDQFESYVGAETADQVRASYRKEGIDVSFSSTLFSLAQSMLFGFILALPVGFAHRRAA